MRRQLEEATRAGEQAAAALVQKGAEVDKLQSQLGDQHTRASELERQIAATARERDETAAKLAAEQQRADAAQRGIEERDATIAQAAADNERLSGQLAAVNTERDGLT